MYVSMYPHIVAEIVLFEKAPDLEKYGVWGLFIVGEGNVKQGRKVRQVR
jgi:hypothetical protein